MDKISDLNPTLAIVWFIATTIIYGFLKYFIGFIENDDTRAEPSYAVNLNMLLYGYLFFTIISAFFINLDLTKQLCDTPQFYTAIFSTIIPWMLIFTTIISLLKLFPGWLTPFSNTFGYGISIIMGIKENFNKLLVENITGFNGIMLQAMTHISSDKSILINEITEDNFEAFWNNLKPVFNTKIDSPTTAALKSDILNIIRAKTIVSEVIWYLLTGLLIISVSYNSIINTNCKKNLEDMKKAKLQYEINKYKEENK